MKSWFAALSFDPQAEYYKYLAEHKPVIFNSQDSVHWAMLIQQQNIHCRDWLCHWGAAYYQNQFVIQRTAGMMK